MNTYEKQGGGGVSISLTPADRKVGHYKTLAIEAGGKNDARLRRRLLQGTGAGKPRAACSVHDAEEECRAPALETCELPKPRRSDVVVHVVEIAVIGEVDHVEAEANLAMVTMPDWKTEVAERLEIDGKESREPLPVGQPNVILPLIHLGIGKTGVHVHDRPKNE